MGLGDPPHQLIFAEIQRCIILEAPSSPLGDPPGGSPRGYLWGIPQESSGDPPALLPLGDPPGIPLPVCKSPGDHNWGIPRESPWGIPQLSFLWGIPQESPWGIPQTGNPATHQVWKPPHLGDPPMIAPGIPLQNSGSPRIRLEAPTSGGSPFFTSGSPLIMHESLQLRL